MPMPLANPRSTFRSPLLIAVIMAILGAAIVVGPTAAGTPLVDYGSTVTCRYKVTSQSPVGWATALLKGIRVAPPEMFATSGQQTVGWRFVVRRSLHRQNGPWTVTYRSPIQTRTATTTVVAAFDAMRVDVNVPDVGDKADVWYLVELRMFRYRADGTVRSKVSYLMATYTWNMVGYGSEPYWDNCPGLAQQFV